MFVLCAALSRSSQLFFVGLVFALWHRVAAAPSLVSSTSLFVGFFLSLFLWKCRRCRDTVWSAFFFCNDTTEWGKKWMGGLEERSQVSWIKLSWRRKKKYFSSPSCCLCWLSFSVGRLLLKKQCGQTWSSHSLASLTPAKGLCGQVCSRHCFSASWQSACVLSSYCQLWGEMVLGTVVDCMLLWHGVFQAIPLSGHCFGGLFLFFCLISGLPFNLLVLFSLYMWVCVWVHAA